MSDLKMAKRTTASSHGHSDARAVAQVACRKGQQPKSAYGQCATLDGHVPFSSNWFQRAAPRPMPSIRMKSSFFSMARSAPDVVAHSKVLVSRQLLQLRGSTRAVLLGPLNDLLGHPVVQVLGQLSECSTFEGEAQSPGNAREHAKTPRVPREVEELGRGGCFEAGGRSILEEPSRVVSISRLPTEMRVESHTSVPVFLG